MILILGDHPKTNNKYYNYVYLFFIYTCINQVTTIVLEKHVIQWLSRSQSWLIPLSLINNCNIIVICLVIHFSLFTPATVKLHQ